MSIPKSHRRIAAYLRHVANSLPDEEDNGEAGDVDMQEGEGGEQSGMQRRYIQLWTVVRRFHTSCAHISLKRALQIRHS
jgi:hypothetical protein